MLLLKHVLDLANKLGCPAYRRAVRQLHNDKERTLVILRQKARRCDLSQSPYAGHGDGNEHQANDRDAHEPRDDGAVAITHPVDAAHQCADRSTPWTVMRP